MSSRIMKPTTWFRPLLAGPHRKTDAAPPPAPTLSITAQPAGPTLIITVR